jgi:hypothetical protein
MAMLLGGLATIALSLALLMALARSVRRPDRRSLSYARGAGGNAPTR